MRSFASNWLTTLGLVCLTVTTTVGAVTWGAGSAFGCGCGTRKCTKSCPTKGIYTNGVCKGNCSKPASKCCATCKCTPTVLAKTCMCAKS